MQPVQILSADATEEKGELARMVKEDLLKKLLSFSDSFLFFLNSQLLLEQSQLVIW